MENLDLSMFDDSEIEANQEELVDDVSNTDGNDLGDGQGGGQNEPANKDDADYVDPNDDGTPGPVDDPEKEEKEGNENDNNIKLVYNNIASLLKEEGLFTNDELKMEDIESSDKLVEALKAEIKSNEFSDLSDTQKEYLEAIREGVPADIFLQHKQVEDDYSSITDAMIANDAELRKNIVLFDLKSKGMSQARADKLFKAMADAGEDIEEAAASLEVLKAAETTAYQAKVEATKAAKAAEQKADSDRIKAVKDSVYERKEIIKNYKLTETLKDKVYQTMTKAVAYSEDGQPMNKLTNDRESNPVEFDTKLYYLYEMTNGFNDFSIFEKKAQSKAAKKLEQIVNDTNLVKTGSNPVIPEDEHDVPVITQLSNDY